LKDAVVWAKYTTPPKQRPFEDIFVEGHVVNGFNFSSRFSVNTSTPGRYHLVIDNVTLDDAALYSCSEKNGQGQTHHIKLVVKGMPTFTYAIA